MDLVLDTPEGRIFNVKVFFLATVLQIKEAIQKLHGFPVERQRLFVRDQIMEDSKKTVDYGLFRGSRILLLLDPPSESPQASLPSPSTPSEERLIVTVLTRCGKKITLDVNSQAKVSELKKELMRLAERRMVSLPEEGFFFIFKRNVMCEERSFSWHGVRNSDTIEIFNGTIIRGSGS